MNTSSSKGEVCHVTKSMWTPVLHCGCRLFFSAKARKSSNFTDLLKKYTLTTCLVEIEKFKNNYKFSFV